MKNVSFALVVCVLLGAATGARSGATPLTGEARLVFDGYMKSSEGVVFLLSLKRPDDVITARAWLAIGQHFAGHEIVSFDSRIETLLVRRAGGENQALKLRAARVRNGAAVSDPKSDGFLRAMRNVNLYLQQMRTSSDETVEFRLDIEGDLMPPPVRTRFLASRDREEAKNGYLVGVCVDQEWIFSVFSAQAASSIIRESLTEAERRRIEVAWALAIAEGTARALAKKKHGDPIPTLSSRK